MEKVMGFLSGKKMYITAIAVGVLGALKFYGIEVPELVYWILGSFGIIGVKSAIAKIEPEKY